MGKYKVSIIGCGDIGFNFDYKKKTDGALTHFKAFGDDKRFEIISAAELNKFVRNKIYNEYKVETYEDYKTMLCKNPADVIVVATNDESHFEILEKIIEYKPKLVFCEKPVALNYDDVKEIVSLYKRNNILLQVNYTRRFLDEFYEIGNIIKNKKLGELESATFYYSRGLIHNASHYLDLINWYIGETEKNLVKVSVKEGINRQDETISFDMIFKNKFEVRFIGLNPTKLSFAEIDIVGTKGRVKVNYKNEIEKYKVVRNIMYKGYSMYELTSVKTIEFTKALPNAVENIYKALSKKEKLKSPADNSIKIFELINRIKLKQVCRN